MADSLTYISVILPLRLEWEPCYSIPENSQVMPGDRVRVLFANREYIGVVSSCGISPQMDLKKIKPVISVESEMERVLPEEISLWRSVSDYYLCTIGEVYKAAYPHGKVNLEEARAAARLKVRQRREKIASGIKAKIAKMQERLEKKQEQIIKSRKDTTRRSYEEQARKLQDEISLGKRMLQEMESGKHSDAGSNIPSSGPEINLSEIQNIAYESILKAFAAGKPVLLHGVTGSGKTEIYTRLAQETLKEGKNVLYLVPEIALSRQLEDRLYEYFGERLMTFHSGESAASRRNIAETIRSASGSPYIVLGTRSSLFLPHHDLGLVIVDEEHDASYKQDSPAPRYNGRDTALILSKLQGSRIILGSATPSLEEVYNCQVGRHSLVELNQRHFGSEDSDIEIIDTKAERRKRGMRGNFSIKLIEHIRRTLERNEQVIILRSRRAWSPVMQCDSCGEIQKCPHCNVSLSLHKNQGGGKMVCHYCGHSETYTGKCRKCGNELAAIGAGTQKIEEEAAQLFPMARIARLDSDSAQNKTFEAKTIKDFSNGKIDILIGTQIVTKGFDFSGLTLVAVIAADSLLGMQDFRADEKAFQILEQFRGRCGRRDRKGLFVIQTSQPDHPIYQRLADNETKHLNNSLLLERKDFSFPPYSRIIEVTVKDTIAERADRMATRLANAFRRHFEAGRASLADGPVTGPYAPVVDKIADHHIRTIRISLKKDKKLTVGKNAVKEIVGTFEKSQKYEGHLTINVDPS